MIAAEALTRNMTAAGDDILAIQRFVEMLMVEAGAAPNTIAAYASDLARPRPRFLVPAVSAVCAAQRKLKGARRGVAAAVAFDGGAQERGLAPLLRLPG